MIEKNHPLQELAAKEGVRLMKCQCGSFQLALGGTSLHLNSKMMQNLCQVLLSGLQGTAEGAMEYTAPLAKPHTASPQRLH